MREALEAIERHIRAAEHAAAGARNGSNHAPAANGHGIEDPPLGRFGRTVAFLGGASVERTWSNLDAVETDLLRLAPDSYLRGALPTLVAHVRAHLPPHDPRRHSVERVARTAPTQSLNDVERDEVLGAVRAASQEARHEIRRVRSFRNILAVTAAALAVGVAAVTIVGAARPDVIPLCFSPDETTIVCPTATEDVPGAAAGGETRTAEQSSAQQRAADAEMRATASAWDVPIVGLVGLLAAALASAFAVRTIRGTSTPYSLPVMVAVLKLPAGALTAVLGLLLMRGGFVPGLSALDTSAQIIAWAVVFGYSQQLLTHFVDRQAKSVLEGVGGAENPQTTPTAAPQPAPTGTTPA